MSLKKSQVINNINYRCVSFLGVRLWNGLDE